LTLAFSSSLSYLLFKYFLLYGCGKTAEINNLVCGWAAPRANMLVSVRHRFPHVQQIRADIGTQFPAQLSAFLRSFIGHHMPTIGAICHDFFVFCNTKALRNRFFCFKLGHDPRPWLKLPPVEPLPHPRLF